MGPTLFCAAPEPFEGVPSFARAIPLESPPSPQILNSNVLEVSNVSGWLGAHISALGQKVSTFSCGVRLAGGGTVGAATPPQVGSLFRGCGWSETLDPANGMTIYKPTQFPRESVKVAYYMHPNYEPNKGMAFIASGCRGQMSMRFPGGEFAMLSADLTGGYHEPLSKQDVRLNAFDESIYNPPEIVGVDSAMRCFIRRDDGTEIKKWVHNIDINQPNNIQPSEKFSQDDAQVQIINARANLTLRLEVDFLDEEDEEWLRMATDRGWFGIKALMGSAAGRVMGFRAKKVQPVSVSLGERNGEPTTILECNIVGYAPSGGLEQEIAECEFVTFAASRFDAGGGVNPAFPAAWREAQLSDVFSAGTRPVLNYRASFIPDASALSYDISTIPVGTDLVAANGFPIVIDSSASDYATAAKALVFAHRLSASGGRAPNMIIAGDAGTDYRIIGQVAKRNTVEMTAGDPWEVLVALLNEDPGANFRIA